MDVYTPDGDNYSERPLIIFAHGGVFITGNKNNTAMVELCEAFAKRGYVTASIQYRLTNFSSLTDSMQMLQTVVNGISDLRLLFVILEKMHYKTVIPLALMLIKFMLEDIQQELFWLLTWPL